MAEDADGKGGEHATSAVETGRWNRRASILMQERKNTQRRTRLGRRSKSQKAASLELDKTRAEAELLERHQMKEDLMKKMESDELYGDSVVLGGADGVGWEGTRGGGWERGARWE